MDKPTDGVFVPLTSDQCSWLEGLASEMGIPVETLLGAAIGLCYRMDNNGPVTGFLEACTERMKRAVAEVDETIAFIDASNRRIDSMLASSPMS